MNYLKNRKSELRKQLLAQRALVSPEDRERMSEKICRRAISLAGFRLAGTILLYAPKEIEVNVYPIAEAAWAQGKAVAFPRCHKSDSGFSYMTYHLVENRSQLKKGTFGIMEPDKDAPLYDPAKDRRGSICFAPAIAFDKYGYRLGYGGGYYDRYFNSYTGSIVGVIFSDFVFDSLPHGKYDIRAGILITEKGVTMTVED